MIDGASGRLVRIGAFASPHQAKRGWWAITQVNPALKHLPALVVPVQSLRNGRVYYRLQMGTTSQAHSDGAVPAHADDRRELRRHRHRRWRRDGMSDDRAFDEPLPWLTPVDDEDEPRGISARKMLAALLVVLLAVALVAATFFWIGRRDSAGEWPAAADQGAAAARTRCKPPNPGGLDIAGESETAFETSAGEDKDSQLDLNKLPGDAGRQAREGAAGSSRRSPPRSRKRSRRRAPAEPKADRRLGQRRPARRLRQPGAGRAGLDGLVGALPQRLPRSTR